MAEKVDVYLDLGEIHDDSGTRSDILLFSVKHFVFICTF